MSLARVGVIGGGLMGREVASAFGRWFVLNSYPVRAELVAVCDLVEKQREWFRQVPTVRLVTSNHDELLASPEVDVVYVAVPHNLHETIYLDVLKAGKDLLAEKPFGIDLEAARTIAATAQSSGRFVRCSSEFPFFPGAQRARELETSGQDLRRNRSNGRPRHAHGPRAISARLEPGASLRPAAENLS